MSKIAVLADRETATYFRLTGVRNSQVAGSREQAERSIEAILNDSSVSLVIVTDQVFDWLYSTLSRMRGEKDFPLIIAIPSKRGGKRKIDPLSDLVKRTVGIEIKVG